MAFSFLGYLIDQRLLEPFYISIFISLPTGHTSIHTLHWSLVQLVKYLTIFLCNFNISSLGSNSAIHLSLVKPFSDKAPVGQAFIHRLQFEQKSSDNSMSGSISASVKITASFTLGPYCGVTNNCFYLTSTPILILNFSLKLMKT